MKGLKEHIKLSIWIAKQLFDRNKATGSVANLSFRYQNKIYITGSGTCFGNLSNTSFSELDLSGERYNNVIPSKELPLHLSIYNEKPGVNAIIHTHSTYSVLWSCLEGLNMYDCLPSHTPYLKMQVGTVSLVPYAKPGTEELFQLFSKYINLSDGWLLSNHGPIVAGGSLLNAFYSLEELEESAKIAWNLHVNQNIL